MLTGSSGSGYRYLCWAESKVHGPPKLDLNGHGPERDVLYRKLYEWLEGSEVRPNLTGGDVILYQDRGDEFRSI